MAPVTSLPAKLIVLIASPRPAPIAAPAPTTATAARPPVPTIATPATAMAAPMSKPLRSQLMVGLCPIGSPSRAAAGI